MIQLYIKFFTPIEGFTRAYLADLLALPLTLCFGLVSVRWIKRLPFFYLSKAMILFTFVYTSVLFELILPPLHSKFTADYMDVVWYLLGSILYYFIQEKLKKDEFYKVV